MPTKAIRTVAREASRQAGGNFERIAPEAIIANEVDGEFTITRGLVDRTHDTGVDAVAFVVGGKLVENLQDLDLTPVPYSNIHFHLFQLTESPHFKMVKVQTFLDGAVNFFSASPTKKAHSGIRDFQTLKDRVLARAGRHPKKQPKIFLHYVCLGTQSASDNLVKEIAQQLQGLRNRLPYPVEFVPYSDERILRTIRDYANRNELTIDASNLFERPASDAIERRFIGEITLAEARRLITTESTKPESVSEFRLGAFSANVRGPLGTSKKINQQIRKTLESDDVQYLPMFNHGLTILCADATHDSENNRLTLKNYQIVNGLQTSMEIHGANVADPDALLTVKIAVSNDEIFKNKTIMATNSQSNVTDEQKLSLLPINRTIRLYFDAMRRTPMAPPLHFEVRHGDLTGDGDRTVDESAEVSSHDRIRAYTLLKAYSGMFSGEPHKPAAGIDKVRAMIEAGLTCERNAAASSYYAAGLSYYRFHKAISEGWIDDMFRRFQYHALALLAREYCTRPDKPLVDQRNQIGSAIIETMWDQHATQATLTKISHALSEAIASYPASHLPNAHIAPEFTNHLFQRLRLVD